MSLLNEAMKECVLMTQSEVNDGYGGQVTSWTEGDSVYCAIVYNSSTQNKIAEAQGTKAIYTITTKKDTVLKFHDVLKRKEDGKIFRVTSDGNDNKTPDSACLNMRQVTAEEWELVQ